MDNYKLKRYISMSIIIIINIIVLSITFSSVIPVIVRQLQAETQRTESNNNEQQSEENNEVITQKGINWDIKIILKILLIIISLVLITLSIIIYLRL